MFHKESDFEAFECVIAKWSISQLTVGLGTMVFVRPKRSADPGRPEHLSLGVQPLQECLQSGAIEFPGKRAGLTIAELLVQQQSLLYLFRLAKSFGVRTFL